LEKNNGCKFFLKYGWEIMDEIMDEKGLKGWKNDYNSLDDHHGWNMDGKLSLRLKDWCSPLKA
jgi:hypothetical protein